MLYVRSALYAVAFYATTIGMLVTLFWLLAAPRAWAMAGLKLHARICLWLQALICGTRTEVRGRENIPSGACLVVAKHQSAWDTFALIPLFDDPAIVLKDELKWIPFYGWFILKFDHILVKRERAAVALKAMVTAAQVRAQSGRQILIFPEGSRMAPGAPPDYKPGYIALYESLGVPLVPLALNSGLFWPRRDWLRHPGTVVVEILPPMAPGRPRAQVRREVEAMIEQSADRLLVEAAEATPSPPLNEAARARLAQIKKGT
jgi:1-acyl-sn-glycerol-3-phosphate acyltransferase